MADNFGEQQNRVLNVHDRSFDNVVFQYRKPPLTSEWNLINQIGNEKIQDLAKCSFPSGWLSTGDILQSWNENLVSTGQVNCSSDYRTNSFKLISKNNNYAIVNGWKLLVQGTNSPDNNNIITLGYPVGQVYDFVFLEVWRKLLGKDDAVYPYGNVLVNPYSDNEIEWDIVGTETTKRVQIQYRIRVVPIDTILQPTSTVFDTGINPIGGRTSGEYSYYTFSEIGSSDIGLYIAGDGSDNSKTALNTVDGYVYAIPMFLVYRRVKSDTLFLSTTMKRTYVDRAGQESGFVSDRPDGMLADTIYKEDIVDYRHKVLTTGKDSELLLENSLAKLIAGQLTTSLKTGFGENGANTAASSGGGTLTKVERINSIGGDNIPSIGTGSNTLSTDFKRRVFSNCEITHDHNVIELIRPGTIWNDGDIIALSSLSLPEGSIVSIDGFFSQEDVIGYSGIRKAKMVSGITSNGVEFITISEIGPNSIVGTQLPLFMEFTFRYSSSYFGFKDVPTMFFEIDKGETTPIATRDKEVPLRFNNSGYLLNYGINPGLNDPGDTTSEDYLQYKGGNYTEEYEFGQQLVIFRTTNSSGIVTLNFNNGKYNGYYIHGIKSVEPEESPGQYTLPVSFTEKRNITISPYVISNYEITVSAYPSTGVKITLYVGSKFLDDYNDTYSIQESLKFFDTTKQGRGVIDTYELIEVIGVRDGVSDNYVIDTVDKPIIALLPKIRNVSGNNISELAAFPFNYSDVSFTINITGASSGNVTLPLLSQNEYTSDLVPTKIKVTPSTPIADNKIRVPVYVHSYVTQNEIPYNFYYKTNPYQGLLSGTSSFYGKIICEGPAFITSMGSGAIENYKYFTGKAIFKYTGDNRKVHGVADTDGNLPIWTSQVQSGDYIGLYDDSNYLHYYRIRSVDSDVDITLEEDFYGTSDIDGTTYKIYRLDVPHDNISNVVDRLPSYKIIADSNMDMVDYTCYSDNILVGLSFDTGFVYTKPKHKLQDPLVTIVNDFKLGNDGSSKRGRNNFVLTDGLNKIFNITNTPRTFIFYDSTSDLLQNHNRKVYQTYLFNRSAKDMLENQTDITGRLYMMVISGEYKSNTFSETSLNGHFKYDTLDVFEIEGRPIVKH